MEHNREENVYPLWVDWDKRVISFHEEEDFQELLFTSHEERLSFVVEKGTEGFGIQ